MFNYKNIIIILQIGWNHANFIAKLRSAWEYYCYLRETRRERELTRRTQRVSQDQSLPMLTICRNPIWNLAGYWCPPQPRSNLRIFHHLPTKQSYAQLFIELSKPSWGIMWADRNTVLGRCQLYRGRILFRGSNMTWNLANGFIMII